ncbi:hypothetical protein BU23DRAFT_554461 [Bimuria novae-zelandiae CBS 107.79]|uniref:Uncharacterized protein n=1 Tax=Bimuria novae-zelandiae CBS 107.79 TaxID=1447943 RepID=A0A6A5V7R8_9PLEO|nr:hypothetical protein BU23DRAFT_554461 [Bimuria novae-zelandiae CBS 107.79]
MVQLLSSIILALAWVAPTVALPEDTSAVRHVMFHVSVPLPPTSDLEKRQETSVETHCYCINNHDPDRDAAANGIANYLDGLPASTKCGLDKKQSYYNLATANINGKLYEANVFFTGRVPQTIKADYSCKDLARELRLLQTRCQNSCKSDRVLEWSWLINCISTPQFSSQPPQPYVEGGVGLEFREAGVQASPPNHS